MELLIGGKQEDTDLENYTIKKAEIKPCLML
jgi:hypothetical protein